MTKKTLLIGLVLGLVISLAGCGTFFLSSDTGTLALYLADLPGNVDAVNVVLDRVEVKINGEQWELINDFSDEGETETFDLLKLQYMEALLGEKELPAGEYSQIRLVLAAPEEGTSQPQDLSQTSHIVKDGEEIPLFIPSGTATGLKIHHKFTVEAGLINVLILDVDVEKLIEAGKSGDHILHPTKFIYVIDPTTTGEITGKVLEDNGNNGEDSEGVPIKITAYRIENEEEEEIATGWAANEEDQENNINIGFFKLRGLPEGDYKLGFSAEGYEDKTYEGSIEVKAGETKDIGDIYLVREGG